MREVLPDESTGTSLTSIYDHADYWEPLRADIRKARGSLVVHVPYITQKGLKRVMPEIEAAIKRGLTVTIVLQRPREWDRRGQPGLDASIAANLDQLEALTKWLTSCGAHVRLRKRIHAKIVLVDEDILWEGSLNFLSHYDTTEHVRRSINRKEVREVRNRHDLNEIPSYATDADIDERIREILLQRREECGLSQADLAKAIAVGPSDVSRLEGGKKRLLGEVFKKVLDVLDLRMVLVPRYLSGPVDSYIKHLMSEPQK